MKPLERNKLTGKFWEGNTSLNEEEVLFTQSTTEGSSLQEEAYFRYIANARRVNQLPEDQLWRNIILRQHRKKRIILITTGIAAACLILVSLSLMISSVNQEKNFENQVASNNFKNYYNAFKIDKNSNPTLFINGCKASSDYHSTLQNINPKCIENISISNVAKEPGKKAAKNGTVEVWLKGEPDEIYSVCEGTLYFYQEGELKSITIDDECSPNLLVDCLEIPLSEIKQLKPQQIKSIELTIDPRNCSGQMDGEYLVLELK